MTSPSASSTAATRVPQADRTRAMRARLLEATVELLVERGFAGTSTTLVSDRAGVSRGAQLHHFPTKNDLVVAAVEHLTERRGAELAACRWRDRPTAAERRTRAVAARCSATTSPHRSSPPRSSSGWRPAPTRPCSPPSARWSSGSAARRTG